jgi:hypothetical protein
LEHWGFDKKGAGIFFPFLLEHWGFDKKGAGIFFFFFWSTGASIKRAPVNFFPKSNCYNICVFASTRTLGASIKRAAAEAKILVPLLPNGGL